MAPTVGASINKCDPPFKQLNNGNRVHFQIGKGPRSNKPASRIGVLLTCLMFYVFVLFCTKLVIRFSVKA